MVDVVAVADPDARGRCAEVLREGGLAVVPTDTVYALVADAFQPEATRQLLEARDAGRGTPLPVFIRSPRQLNGLTEEPGEQAERLVAAFWPGPLTLVFTATDGLTWDLGDSAGTVAIRMPADDWLHELIAEVGPIAATSANTTAALPPSTAAAAKVLLGDRPGIYIDGGTRAGQVSTIVDVTRGGAEVLRLGAVSADEVFQAASGAVGWGAPDGGEEA